MDCTTGGECVKKMWRTADFIEYLLEYPSVSDFSQVYESQEEILMLLATFFLKQTSDKDVVLCPHRKPHCNSGITPHLQTT